MVLSLKIIVVLKIFTLILRRGNPLYLDDERYNKLQNMWLFHEVSGEVVRSMEHNSRHAAYIDWTNM